MAIEKKVFTQKTYGAQIYKWSPSSSDRKVVRTSKPFYCNATGGSQGQDWISTYSYNIVITPNGEQQKLAYVECDYVQ